MFMNKKEYQKKSKWQSEYSDTTTSSEDETEHKKGQGEQFKKSIKAFVKDIEEEPIMKVSMSSIRDKYQFQRRRLYDVIRVFEAIGCCMKTGVDTIIWLGLKNIYPSLLKLAKESKVFDKSMAIEQVLQSDPSISIAKLTQNFFLSYFALNEQCLDIRSIASFISRDNGRYKSTLCKLYQITFILESVGIVERQEVAGLLRISDSYFVQNPYQSIKPKVQVSFLDINSLLNRPEQQEEDYINIRRNGFHGYPVNQKAAFLNILEHIAFSSPIPA